MTEDDEMNHEYLTAAELNAYVERAHQLRAEATRDGLRAAAAWLRGLFAGAVRTA